MGGNHQDQARLYRRGSLLGSPKPRRKMRFAYRRIPDDKITIRNEEPEKAWMMLAMLQKRKVTFVYVVPDLEEE